MNELVQSIRADLTSRRLLPLLVLFVLGLIGALGYVALGASSSSKPPAPIAAAPLPGGLPVTVAPPNATQAVSETPAGAGYQTHGATRNPFKPLVEPKAPAATGPAGAGASSSSSTGSSKSSGNGSSAPGSSGTNSAGSAPAGHTAPVPVPTGKPVGPKPIPKPQALPGYTVSVLFGPAPATPEQQPALTPYEDLKLFEPLPSAKAPRLVFVGVRNNDQAVFGLITPTILRGPATCYPSPSQCQYILLIAGAGEELEYVNAKNESFAFELKVVRISKRNASSAKAQSLRVSKAGRQALAHAGLWALR